MYHMRVTTYPLAEHVDEVVALIGDWVKDRQTRGYIMGLERQSFATEWPIYVSTFQFNSLSDIEAYGLSLKADDSYSKLWKKIGPLMRGPAKQELFYVEIPYAKP